MTTTGVPSGDVTGRAVHAGWLKAARLAWIAVTLLVLALELGGMSALYDLQSARFSQSLSDAGISPPAMAALVARRQSGSGVGASVGGDVDLPAPPARSGRAAGRMDAGYQRRAAAAGLHLRVGRDGAGGATGAERGRLPGPRHQRCHVVPLPRRTLRAALDAGVAGDLGAGRVPGDLLSCAASQPGELAAGGSTGDPGALGGHRAVRTAFSLQPRGRPGRAAADQMGRTWACWPRP